MTTKPTEAAVPTLEQEYQRLVDQGLVVPVERMRPFKYPSRKVNVATMTTYGAADPRRPEEVMGARLAELEPGSR